MANDGTALGAMNEIIENAGGTPDAQTLVPAIEQLGEVIAAGGGGGGGIADGSVTTAKLARGAVTSGKLDLLELENDGSIASIVTTDQHIRGGIPFKIIAVDETAQNIIKAMKFDTPDIVSPADLANDNAFTYDATVLVWVGNDNALEAARLQFRVSLRNENTIPYVYARGYSSTASGILGVDESWTIE